MDKRELNEYLVSVAETIDLCFKLSLGLNGNFEMDVKPSQKPDQTPSFLLKGVQGNERVVIVTPSNEMLSEIENLEAQGLKIDVPFSFDASITEKGRDITPLAFQMAKFLRAK